MPDAILRELWTAAIIIRGLSFCLGIYRRVPCAWLGWAGFSVAASLILRALDHPGPAYRNAWIAEQFINAVLLGFVTWQECRPSGILAAASGFVSLLAAAALLPASRSTVPLVMWGCGICLLALGAIATVTAINDRRPRQSVLAVYLISSCLLLLAGQDYLNQAGLGRAWSLLEIAAFTAWIFW